MMTRRDLLALTTASAFGVEPDEIVDTHVHFYDPDRPGGVPWPAKTDKILYRRAMPENYQTISKARCLIVEASPLFSDNQWILGLSEIHRWIEGFIGHLDPADSAFAKHVEHFQKNPKFLGIRLSTDAARAAFEKLAPLEQAAMSLDLIGNGEMYMLAARLSDRYPNLRIILNHLPLTIPDASIRELTKRKNIYAKVSWILRHADDRLENHLEALDEVWQVFGENRVVYGSNWPVCDTVVPYSKVQQTAITYFRQKPLHKYLFTNSRAAYRWGKAHSKE